MVRARVMQSGQDKLSAGVGFVHPGMLVHPASTEPMVQHAGGVYIRTLPMESNDRPAEPVIPSILGSRSATHGCHSFRGRLDGRHRTSEEQLGKISEAR